MKLINKTHWDTKQLRKLTLETLKRYPVPPKHYKITVVPARRASISGLGYLGLPWIIIKAPNPKYLEKLHQQHRKGWDYECKEWIEVIPIFSVKNYVVVFTHEIGHTLGLNHIDMCGDNILKWQWAKDFIVEEHRDESGTI